MNKLNKIIKIIQSSSHDISTSIGKSNERYRRILYTAGSTAIVKVFSALINLISVPLTVNYLGAERYGIWMTISSVMTLMTFADLGLGNGLLNAISKAHGKNNIKEAQIAVSSTFFLLLIISGILLLVFLITYPHIEWHDLLNVHSKLAKKEIAPTVLIVVVIFLINIPLGIIQRIQDGYQEGFIFQISIIGGSIISLAGLLICVYFKAGLPWLVLVFSGSQLFAVLFSGILLFSKRRKELFPLFSYYNFNTSKYLIKQGSIFFILTIFSLVGNTSDNIILARYIDPASVAGYEIVKKLFLFSMFTQFIIQPLWPAFGEALESGDIEWVKRTFKKILKLSILSSSIISLPLLLYGRQIIEFWVGSELIPGWSLLIGFYIFVLFANYGGVMSTLLNSGELLKKQVPIIGLASISSIFLKIVLLKHIGVSGVIWATVIGYSVFYIIPTYRIASKYLNLKS
ncbi:MAG: lipopolysaccharide biosynthesis protein [Sediminibacterium sp.]